jgi:hypothetical protein
MPTQCSQEELDFGSSGGRKLVGAFDGGAITSNGGALLLGAADRSIRLTDRLAKCFRDLRLGDGITHTIADLLRQRIFGLALGYEDLIDHDQLRHDPALAAVLDKPGGRLAGKSTLNRLEHADKIGQDRHHKFDHDGAAIERLFPEVFMDAFCEPPIRIEIDLDATDDPLYGQQEGRHFHGYYDCLYERTGVKPLLPSAQSFCSTSVLIFSSRPWFPNSAARKIGQGWRVSAARRARP